MGERKTAQFSEQNASKLDTTLLFRCRFFSEVLYYRASKYDLKCAHTLSPSLCSSSLEKRRVMTCFAILEQLLFGPFVSFLRDFVKIYILSSKRLLLNLSVSFLLFLLLLLLLLLLYLGSDLSVRYPSKEGKKKKKRGLTFPVRDGHLSTLFLPPVSLLSLTSFLPFCREYRGPTIAMLLVWILNFFPPFCNYNCVTAQCKEDCWLLQ